MLLEKISTEFCHEILATKVSFNNFKLSQVYGIIKIFSNTLKY